MRAVNRETSKGMGHGMVKSFKAQTNRSVKCPRVLLGVCLLWQVNACPMRGVSQAVPQIPALIHEPAGTDQPRIEQGPQERPAQPAIIEFSAGELKITADGSSLRDILGSIGNKVGMRIVGNVPDERVFGVYGPGAIASVISSLLAGTGSNLIITQSRAQSAAQLVLTRRNGGPSPPLGKSLGEADGTFVLPQHGPRNSSRPGNSSAMQGPVKPLPSPVPASVPQAPSKLSAIRPLDLPLQTGTGALTDANLTQERSPNGIKTPQEIAEQLKMLEQPQQTVPTTVSGQVVDVPQGQSKPPQSDPRR